MKKNQTSDNNEHNEQQKKNQLFLNNTCNLKGYNKTATENTDNGLSEIPTGTKNISPKHENFKREFVTNNLKHRRALITKLKKNK